MKRPTLPCPVAKELAMRLRRGLLRVSRVNAARGLISWDMCVEQRETELYKQISWCMAIQVLWLLGSYRLAGKDCARDHDVAGSGGNDVALRPVRAESHGSDPVALAQMLLELEMTESRDREDGPATGTVEFILEHAVRECLEFGARVGWKVSSTSFSVVRPRLMTSRSARDTYVHRKCTRSLDKAKFVTNDVWFGIFGLDPGVGLLRSSGGG